MWLMLSTSVAGNALSDMLSHVLYINFVRDHQGQVAKSKQDDYAIYRDTVCLYSSRVASRALVEFMLLPTTIVSGVDCMLA